MQWIGYIAAILTTASFLPQVIHTIRIKDTRSISLGMYSMFVLGTCCWIYYGVVLASWPIILANILTAVLTAIVLCRKVRNKLAGHE